MIIVNDEVIEIIKKLKLSIWDRGIEELQNMLNEVIEYKKNKRIWWQNCKNYIDKHTVKYTQIVSSHNKQKIQDKIE